MYNRIKPTMTVYPCRYRSQPGHPDIETEGGVWMTWESIEREHFNPQGAFVADFSKPIEVDASLVKNHCYTPELLAAEEVC